MAGSYQVIKYGHNGTYRTARYQTEHQALKAVWRWLRDKPDADHAVCLFPESAPRTIYDWHELPFEEPTDKATDFRQTKAWRQLREKAIDQYGNRCVRCGKTPRDGVRIEVDHIKPASHYPELALDMDNLQILCETCNRHKSNRSEKQWR